MKHETVKCTAKKLQAQKKTQTYEYVNLEVYNPVYVQLLTHHGKQTVERARHEKL